MARNINLIGCTNVRVDPDVENFIAIDCQDMQIDASYSNKTIMKNGAITLSEGRLQDGVNEVADFVTGVNYGTYYCDCTSQNIEATLIDSGRPYTFIKTSGANDLVLVPDSGTIDGNPDYTVTTPVTAYFDGTNWYVK